jgi:hypothetical protein
MTVTPVVVVENTIDDQMEAGSGSVAQLQPPPPSSSPHVSWWWSYSALINNIYTNL